MLHREKTSSVFKTLTSIQATKFTSAVSSWEKNVIQILMCLAIFKCLFIFFTNEATVMKTHKVEAPLLF